VPARGEEGALAATVDEPDGEGGRSAAGLERGVQWTQLASEPRAGLVVSHDREQLRPAAQIAHGERRIRSRAPGTQLTALDQRFGADARPAGNRAQHEIDPHIADDGQRVPFLPHRQTIGG